MKEVFILIFISIGLVSILEPTYKKFLSELDKANQGKGFQISFWNVAKSVFIAILMFLAAYLISVVQINIFTYSNLAFLILLIAFANLLIGCYIFYLYTILLGIKPNKKA